MCPQLSLITPVAASDDVTKKVKVRKLTDVIIVQSPTNNPLRPAKTTATIDGLPHSARNSTLTLATSDAAATEWTLEDIMKGTTCATASTTTDVRVPFPMAPHVHQPTTPSRRDEDASTE